MKKVMLFILLMVLVFAISCGNKKSEIEDSYLVELENQYSNNDASSIQTESYDIFADENSTDSIEAVDIVNPAVDNRNVDNNRTTTKQRQVVGNTSTRTHSPSTANNTKVQTTKTTKTYSRPKTFTSKWVDTKDSQVIKDVRLLIANRQYREAQNYINRLNMDNLPGTDIGHLHQFNGIINYFLIPVDDEAFSVAIESFQKAYEETGIEKFRPLSILWLGMLYEKYSNNTVELQQALNLFDEVINNYSDTRFVNDAVFYKALVLKKLGQDDEYNELILSLKNNVYPDNLIYSRWNNDYVNKDIVLSKYANIYS